MSCLMRDVIQGLSVRWIFTDFSGKLMSIAVFTSVLNDSVKLSTEATLSRPVNQWWLETHLPKALIADSGNRAFLGLMSAHRNITRWFRSPKHRKHRYRLHIVEVSFIIANFNSLHFRIFSFWNCQGFQGQDKEVGRGSPCLTLCSNVKYSDAKPLFITQLWMFW